MKNDKKNKEPNISIFASILIAIVLWIYVIGQVDPNVNQNFNNIPVDINNLHILEENGLVLAENQDFSVNISVYGRTSILYGLKSQIKASIDIGEITSKGTYNLKVHIEGIPENVALKNVDPLEISLVIDQITTEERSIELDIDGEPQSGLTILDYDSNPSKVNISGPEEILKTVSKIVGKIDIKDAKSDVTKAVKLKAVDKNNIEIEGIIFDSVTSEVTVHIGKTKTVEILPRLSGDIPEGYTISKIILEPNEITIGAKNDLLDDIEAIMTEQIELADINSNFKKEVKLVLPSGVNIIKGKSTVILRIMIEKIETKEYNISKVDIANKPEDKNISLPEEYNIKVVLEGSKADLNTIKEEDIKLYLDLQELKDGDNDIDIEMEEIEGLKLVSITPKKTVVTVTE